MPSASVEEYLESIYKLSTEGVPLRAVRLAEHMHVSAASVAEMLRKLVNQKLVERSADMEITLTDDGRRAALRLLRRHRLSERFLTDLIGLPWDKVHDEACRFEHVLSPEVEEGLDRLLKRPETCPHGYPIPAEDGRIADSAVGYLSDCEVGDTRQIARVPEDDPELLRYLASLGISPGAEVAIDAIAPFNGPIQIRVGSEVNAISRELAAKIGTKI